MNRRSFLKFMGMATVGGAVAYSFPSIIVPQNIIPVETLSATPLSFTKLMDVYNAACIKNLEPNLVLVNRETFNKVISYMSPQMRFINENGNTRFRNAEIVINEYLQNDEVITMPNKSVMLIN